MVATRSLWSQGWHFGPQLCPRPPQPLPSLSQSFPASQARGECLLLREACRVRWTFLRQRLFSQSRALAVCSVRTAHALAEGGLVALEWPPRLILGEKVKCTVRLCSFVLWSFLS